MKGYVVEYTTPYEGLAEKVFVPADMYVSFLTCINDQKAEVMTAVLTDLCEYLEKGTKMVMTEDDIPILIPVLDAESFGWLATVGSHQDGKHIFIPDTQLEDVVRRSREKGSSLTLLRWTNKIMFGLADPATGERRFDLE